MIGKLLIALVLPTVSLAAVQCYVGQKLFSFESSNAVCAKFIPYTCAVQCEWRRQCNEHSAFSVFRGRRTFVSGVLLNSKSLMVLCCASLATRVETDSAGREKCIWREKESIAVLGPSIRTNPVLAPNHYIRDVKMDRDGSSRVDVALEICQYQSERDHCNVEQMTDIEKRRFSIIQSKLQKVENLSSTTSPDIKSSDEDDLVRQS
ncbi:unnamed protein product [Caenorhabditis auriculariae]|uniref:Secreted protein n=1 Tax=Caenorhabditis auriculariae TaxID=2777116 RepID=A0A8S1H5V8_9PELO|nr:unnamed protein product [Caenorhabditis auriculariae]